jgi:hypothetical protein
MVILALSSQLPILTPKAPAVQAWYRAQRPAHLGTYSNIHKARIQTPSST